MSEPLRAAASLLWLRQPQMMQTRIGDLIDHLAGSNKGLIIITPGTLAEPGAAIVVALDPQAAKDVAGFVKTRGNLGKQGGAP